MKEIPVTRYSQFAATESAAVRLRARVREMAILFASLVRRIDTNSEWIRFLLYHQVLDDERLAFAAQLAYLRNFGDFISLDDSVTLLERGGEIRGRFFCVTFDDGYKSCATNALPLLVEKKVPAAFFLPINRMGGPPNRILAARDEVLAMEFMDWADCRRLAGAGMVIGSHTFTHPRLAQLSAQVVTEELVASKQRIEQELGCRCEHFCCPWGMPGRDFLEERDPAIAKAVGYRSFLTTRRGVMKRGDSPYGIRRDGFAAHSRGYELRYFLSRE